jgi:hypothetical protein
MSSAAAHTEKPVRHILSLSGGKDSTALAIYMKDRVPEMEYVFCDTEKELPETYEYMQKLEAYLGKEIVVLKHGGKGFDELLKMRGGYLPSAQARWCTEYLKIKPFEKFIGDDQCISYIGIRADEKHRKGYISTKTNIQAKYPFIEDGLVKEDIFKILESSGIGIPDYYQWRSRSGCYFCFFQRRFEWVGLLVNHPDLYQLAMEYEKISSSEGVHYTWAQSESLSELMAPERIEKIKREYDAEIARVVFKKNQTIANQLAQNDELVGDEGCLVCHL